MNSERIESSIDVDRMKNAVVTSVGGCYGLCDGLVRDTLGKLNMIDFDHVDSSNPARQDFNSADLGQHKVKAAASGYLRINPELEIQCYTRDYCSFSPDEMDELFGDTDLFIFATDSFIAQAKGNVDVMRMNKPAIWIGLYREGRAGEIIYHVPGVTEACYRCICVDRYNAFYSKPANVHVGSSGATIHDLRFIDSIAGSLAVGILTRGAPNRFGQLIDKLGNRNLIQVRMDPDYRLGDKDIFGKYLGNNPANFSFNSIALTMERESDCPDCRSLHQKSQTLERGNYESEDH